MFKMLDTDNSGQITLEELKTGLQRVGANLKESEIATLMEAVTVLTYSSQHGTSIFSCMLSKIIYCLLSSPTSSRKLS